MFCPLSGSICLLSKNIKTYQIINGHPIEVSVCSNCPALAMQMNGWETFLRHIFHHLRIDQVLSPEELESAVAAIKNKDELNSFLEDLATKKKQLQETHPCPSCGLDLHILLESGKIGCPHCYDHFREFIRVMAQRCQDRSSKHQGKRPKTKINLLDIKNLEREMATAIKEERYEDAGKIRDRIKEMRVNTA